MKTQISEIAISPDKPSLPSNLSDSALLSCYAATELDTLLMRGGGRLDCVRSLISFIQNQVSEPKLERDPETIMALNWAFVDSNLLRPSIDTTIDDLFNEASKVSVNLRNIVERPDYYREQEPSQVRSLRDFCLLLSKRFFAYDPSLGVEETNFPEIP